MRSHSLAQPAQMPYVFVRHGRGQFDLDGDRTPTTVHDEVDFVIIVSGSQMAHTSTDVGCICFHP